ncbi:hypothetical protein Rsub_09847 [Raphidocelis subcapitata]|uniref:Uncharacterized protein n=1 Tax=Raphidocelis subcapitata TaxID=307507 RepID=A0A2V0PHI2_9CHLO|nr:hypothetical protein Rsub_09847 [Raphidocelis subcapitata]|eukprot:GBF96505.1 hypothetical protein Rsub_09847 [Raphidocelis subcapitata]
MPPAFLPALSDDILHYMATTCWEKTAIYDEADICRDAAALMCAGSAFATSLGTKLYGVVSPFRGDDCPGGVDEHSTAAAMRALLKEWELTVGGKKGDLWARIREEVEGGSDACPISRGAKARAVKRQTERIAFFKAHTWGVTKSQVRDLPYVEEYNGRGFAFGGGGAIKTYAIKDIKPIARRNLVTWKQTWAQVEAANTSRKESKKASRKLKDVRTAELFAELARRGSVSEDWARAVLRRFLLPVYRWESSPEPAAETLRAAADEVERHCFLFRFTSYSTLSALMEADYQAARGGKVKWLQMKDEVEPAAQRRALEHWCRGHPSLEAALARPQLPASMHAAITQAWQAAATAGQAAAGAGAGAGAGPSGV